MQISYYRKSRFQQYLKKQSTKNKKLNVVTPILVVNLFSKMFPELLNYILIIYYLDIRNVRLTSICSQKSQKSQKLQKLNLCYVVICVLNLSEIYY